ncbi:MAG: magnesium/cobalt transporter CorA [Promethearchaeota archaeon]
MIDYNEEKYSINEDIRLESEISIIKEGIIRWVNITGISDEKIVDVIGKYFNLHPLVLEDILNPDQRPKFEDYGDYIFIVLKRILWHERKEIFEFEQISLIFGHNYVISFSEYESDVFNPILTRIETAKGRIRKMNADYLTYTLIDVVVDNYFTVLEDIREIIDTLEDNLIKSPEPDVLQAIHKLKRNIIDLRRLIWPLRELLGKIQRESSKLISDELNIYYRDVYDHVFRISELLDNYRDIMFGMLDMYLSSVSNRMNDIMKVLTMISTIFIPLSFLAGFYGMNFIDVPEFSAPFAYPVIIIVMIIIAVSMVMYFRKKKWI